MNFNLIFESSGAQEFFLLLLLICTIGIVLKGIVQGLRNTEEETGLSAETVFVSVDGAQALPTKEYISEIQGLAGRPDAVIIENGFFIPVERKPLAKKIRDRYQAQLLVYMRLIEEFEGKKPPYGYLILGANARKVKVENTNEKQAWLNEILTKMNNIIQGAPAVPDPQPSKCLKCDVKERCLSRADLRSVVNLKS